MARPKKDPSETRSKDLTIPVTVVEGDCIKSGARAAGMDMATWARPILIAAAKRETAKTSGRKSDK